MTTRMANTVAETVAWLRKKGFAEPVGRLGHHWFLFGLLVLFPLLAIWGYVGVVYGLPLHFREDPSLYDTKLPYRQLLIIANSPSFLTHAFTTFFAGLFWLTAAVMNPDEDRLFRRLSASKEIRYLTIRILPIAAAMLFAAAYPASPVVPPVRGTELLRCVLGVGLGLAVFLAYAQLSRLIGARVKYSRSLVLLLLLICLILSLHVFPKLLTVVSLFKLLAGVTAFYILINLAAPRWRFPVFLLCVFFPLLLGGLSQYKYSFNDMEDLYRHPVPLEAQSAVPAERSLGFTRSLRPTEFRPPPAIALGAFAKTGIKLEGRRLIVVAASGGAYRATFWTAMVLDNLRRMSQETGATPGLASFVRLVTGASGGVVGGAYFATLNSNELTSVQDKDQLVALIQDDINQRQRSTLWKYNLPLPRDSLSDVAQQMANWDSLSLFSPWGPLANDRGRTLQKHWGRLGELDGKPFTFERLSKLVAEGSGASLILSPMIVETGQPLLISDLDLTGIADAEGHNTMDFFGTFPGTWDKFTLQTAVRMSATFPYVSPSVSLPTSPPRRVVDAGYIDNYGMATALSYLRQQAVREWMKANKLAGAIIVQINAFPVLLDAETTRKDCVEPAPYEGFEPSRSFGWLLSPFEGLSSARDRSMVFRSEQALVALQDIYAEDGLKLTRVAFENASRSSLSWYLPKKDFDCMTSELENHNNARAAGHVRKAWEGAPGDWNWPQR